MTSKGFLGLDMELVRDIVYLFGEECHPNTGFETKELIWILKQKGYGRDKVVNTLRVMHSSSLLLRKMRSRHGKRFWIWSLSAMWYYSRDFFKANKEWRETAPLFNDIRKEYETLKSQGFIEREKGVV